VTAFARRRLAELEPQREPTLFTGIVLGVRTQMSRRGKMAIVLLDDASAQIEVTVYSELWDSMRSKIREDELLVVEGKVSRDDFSGGLRVVADQLLTLAEARGRYARLLKLSFDGLAQQQESASRLQALLSPYRAADGACPVRIAYRNAAAETELSLPEGWRVRLEDSLIAALHDWLTRERAKVIYR
jgi:DNA polymerase-3 subunit alpha